MDKWIEEAAAECDNLLSHRGLKTAFAAIIQRHYEASAGVPDQRQRLHWGPEPCPRRGGKRRIVP